MLTENDVNWIKNNRSEITANRTESVTLIVLTESGKDPYTNEPITSETSSIVNAVWKKIPSIANHDRAVVDGVELRKGDVKVSFNSDVDLTQVTKVIRKNVDYTLVTVDDKGIGAVNRYECIVRRIS